MILRRVTAHFRRQEWTAIALDFLIVVVGVFIGLQASNWNEMRRERALEREYLERLHSDLQESLAMRSDREEWNASRVAQQALILNDLRSGVLPEEDREAFQQGLAYFGFVGSIDVDWSTVDELQSTGAMNIIRDVGLRSLILRTDSELRRRQAIIENFYQSIYAFRQEIGGQFGVTQFTGEREAVELSYDFEALAADTRFINMLSQIDFLCQFIWQFSEQEKQDISHLRDEVARQLGLGDGASAGSQ